MHGFQTQHIQLMASLHLPFSASTNNPSAAPRRLYPKPSHFINSAKRAHRLQVSCTTDGHGQKHNPKSIETSQGKVDRRNMLIGLGGLYGATSLISAPGASADPVQPPDLKECSDASYVIPGHDHDPAQTVEVNCCPPAEKPTDYILPPVTRMKTRPAAHKVSPEYILKYNRAINMMKGLRADDPRSFMQQANIHCAYCNFAYKQPGEGDLKLQVHESWLFFPFHRWYLYFYERILGKMIDDPTFALPFWNWDHPKGMKIPPMFNDPKTTIYNERRDQEHRPPAVVKLGGNNDVTDTLQIISNNLAIMHTEMIRGVSEPTDFLGNIYRQGTNPSPGAGSLENGAHNSVHDWVGDPRQPAKEDMGIFYSAARDPLFYSHHGNVDRMWTIWQYYLPSITAPNEQIKDPDFLNASFVFYDENCKLVRVYVKDCVCNLAMGYDYERIDLPWVNYKPPAQTATAKVTRALIKADKADTVFPLKLDRIVRVLVRKTKKGKADELLMIENIIVDSTKFVKFDVFINDEDDSVLELDKAAYVGTYSRIPPRTPNKQVTTSIQFKLKKVYDDMDVDDDDEALVTLVPRHLGPGVTIGGIKIIENPPKATASTS